MYLYRVVIKMAGTDDDKNNSFYVIANSTKDAVEKFPDCPVDRITSVIMVGKPFSMIDVTNSYLDKFKAIG